MRHLIASVLTALVIGLCAVVVPAAGHLRRAPDVWRWPPAWCTARNPHDTVDTVDTVNARVRHRVAQGSRSLGAPDGAPAQGHATVPRVTPPPHDGWWCECTVSSRDDPRDPRDPRDSREEPREWTVAGYRASSPHLALEWLKRQASRLADRIDPDPVDTCWAPVSLLRPIAADQAGPSVAAPDPATALRRWPGDITAYDQALRALRDGSLYTFSTADSSLRYRLSARPVLTVAPARSVAAPPRRRRRRERAA